MLQVFHSGVPVTLVPLDATNTIPINKQFFETFENNQKTYEAQYVFLSLKIARDTWFDEEFYQVSTKIIFLRFIINQHRYVQLKFSKFAYFIIQ